MIVLRAFKTELDLNNRQKTACTQHAGAARWAYNWGLARKIEAYQKGEKVPTAIDLHRELNALKKGELAWMYEVCGLIIDRDLNAAFNLESWPTASSAGIDACGEGVRPGYPAVLDEAGTEPRSTAW